MNDQPLRLATGSHKAGSGQGCAMNVISWENGDTIITDIPACADPMLARIVQGVNDSICTHTDTGLLCPTSSACASPAALNVSRRPRTATSDVIAAAKTEGVLAGLDLHTKFANRFPGLDERDLLVAVTEKRSDAEIDAFAALLGRLGGR